MTHRYKLIRSRTNSGHIDDAGYSTELSLSHTLHETWKRGVDTGLVVAVSFVDLKQAFDSVSYTVLEKKLERDFGVSKPPLD